MTSLKIFFVATALICLGLSIPCVAQEESGKSELARQLRAGFIENARAIERFDVAVQKWVLLGKEKGKGEAEAAQIAPFEEDLKFRLIMDRGSKKCVYVSKKFLEGMDPSQRDSTTWEMEFYSNGVRTTRSPFLREDRIEKMDFDEFCIHARIPAMELAGLASVPCHVFSPLSNEMDKIAEMDLGTVRTLADGTRILMLNLENPKTEASVYFHPVHLMPTSIKSVGRYGLVLQENRYSSVDGVYRLESMDFQEPRSVSTSNQEFNLEAKGNTTVRWLKFRSDELPFVTPDQLGRDISVWETFVKGDL